MSDFTEAVVASLTSEWRSTAEIAGAFRSPRRANPLTAHVYKVLATAEKRGIAER